MRIFFIFLFLFFSDYSFATENEAVSNNSKISLLSEKNRVQKGDEFIIGLKFELNPGWHTYWINPGDSGLPMEINWTLPEGLEIKNIMWPSPEIAALDPLISYGYYDELILPILIKANDSYKEEGRFSARLNFLVCKDVCIPEEAEIFGNLFEFSNEDILRSQKLINIWMEKVPKGFQDRISAKISDGTFQLNWKSESAAKEVYFYPEQEGLISYNAKQFYKFTNKESTLTVDRPDRNKVNYDNISGILEISDGTEKKYFVLNSSVEKASFINADKTLEPTLILIVLMAFVGGLILNFMPCVFPVIALKVLSFIKESGEKGAWKHGIAFTFGVEVTMMILFFATFTAQNLGQSVGWGWQLQSSAVSSFLALLFFVIGLVLFFRIEFGANFTKLGNFGIASKGYTNSVLLGLLTVIVATPCTGPYMGVAIGWGLVQPPLISMLVFIFLGFGVAFPTLLLSLVPSAMDVLPKPGRWMDIFNRFMSIPMFLTSLWLAWVAFNQTGMESLSILLLSFFVLLACVIVIKYIGRKSIISLASIIIFLNLILVVSFFPDSKPNNQKNISLGEKWSSERVMELRVQKKNILVNFTADWCLTCKVNERVITNSEEFKKMVKNEDIHYLVGDWTTNNPEITEQLAYYKRAGVPLYLYWRAGSDEVKILPAILTKGILYDHLDIESY